MLQTISTTEFWEAIQNGQTDFASIRFEKDTYVLFNQDTICGLCLDGAHLNSMNMIVQNISYTSFMGANLRGIQGDGTSFTHVTFQDALLIGASMTHCQFTHCSFQGANLAQADFRFSTFQHCTFQDTHLLEVNFEGATFGDGVVGILDPRTWLDTHLRQDSEGWLAYKVMGAYYHPLPTWVMEPGSILEDVQFDPSPFKACAKGIHSSTASWLREHIQKGFISIVDPDTSSNREQREKPVWLVRLRYEWFDQKYIIVPYTTDGKIRSYYLQLVRPIMPNEFLFNNSLYEAL